MEIRRMAMKNILLVIVTILVGWSMCSCGVTSEKEKQKLCRMGKMTIYFPQNINMYQRS